MITADEILENNYAALIKRHLPTAEREKIVVTEFGQRINTIRAVINQQRKVREEQIPLIKRLVYTALDHARAQHKKTAEIISEIEEMIQIAA